MFFTCAFSNFSLHAQYTWVKLEVRTYCEAQKRCTCREHCNGIVLVRRVWLGNIGDLTHFVVCICVRMQSYMVIIDSPMLRKLCLRQWSHFRSLTTYKACVCYSVVWLISPFCGEAMLYFWIRCRLCITFVIIFCTSDHSVSASTSHEFVLVLACPLWHWFLISRVSGIIVCVLCRCLCLRAFDGFRTRFWEAFGRHV